MSIANVHAALNAQLKTVSEITDDVVAWVNRGFEPTPGTAWYRPTFMPAEPSSPEIMASSPNRHVGVYQVSIFWPQNTGYLDAETKAAAIVAAFSRGTTLTYSGTAVRIERSWYERGIAEPDWYHVPVTIAWRSDIAN